MFPQSSSPKKRIAASVVSCSILLFGFEPAVAETGQVSSLEAVDFDLARDCPPSRGASEAEDRQATGANGLQIDWRKKFHGLSAKEKYGPHWSYRPGPAAPKLQVAALGAGSKKYPRVAHVAMDWEF